MGHQSKFGWVPDPHVPTHHVRYVWSGFCMCGHSHLRHHGAMICNPDYIDDAGYGRVPGACLAFGCNENAGDDEYGEPHCNGYVDTLDPDRRAHWDGTCRPQLLRLLAWRWRNLKWWVEFLLGKL